jgi:fatty-acyl-CoA synthase
VGAGAAMAPAAFSASGLNYVGKPLAYVLATPGGPDDHDNPLRVAFGNEASDRDIAEFSRRFDCTVWDGFGSTEGAIIITRENGCPPGSLGRGFPGVAIYNPDTLTECPAAGFDEDGALTNADEAIGELVNTSGAGLSPATTTTRKPPMRDFGTACSGRATSPTGTPMGGSTSPGAAVTGCASTEKT